MAHQFERTFRVRHYECDAYETVYYTNYLRYIQETAMDASADAGFGGEWYAAQGRIWLVRDTKIAFLEPLRYGDAVCVRTWVQDMRASMSKRAYELRRVRDDVIVARAETDWAYIDTTTGRPARIPAEIRDALVDPDLPYKPRESFPSAPSSPASSFTQRRRVEWRDIDPAQHVNNSVYLAYAEDYAVETDAAFGWTQARMRASGFALAYTEFRIDYRQSAVFGDSLDITSWVSNVDGGHAVRHFELVRVSDGAQVARVRAVMTCRSVEGGSPLPMHPAYIQDIQPIITEETLT